MVKTVSPDITGYLKEFLFFGAMLAGLLSIAHCALMCGPIVLVFRSHPFFYQGGRILGYTSAGIFFGFLGKAVDNAGLYVSIQNLALYLTLAILVVFLLYTFLPIKKGEGRLAQGFVVFRTKVMQKARTVLPEQGLVALAGILSALIPCGVLYPVWMFAVSTGSPLHGGLAGLGFVLGTIPSLAIVTALGRKVNFHRPLLKYASAVVLLVSALSMVVFRGSMIQPLGAKDVPACHKH